MNVKHHPKWAFRQCGDDEHVVATGGDVVEGSKAAGSDLTAASNSVVKSSLTLAPDKADDSK